MNVVNAGSRYQIYGEDVKTYKTLPVGTYEVQFSQMQGFYLTQRHDLVVTEDKIYGSSLYKISKVIKSYQYMNRNFGVLLSGQKGIGKSLFVKLLAQEVLKIGLPVVTVTMSVPGIASFISSIDQECAFIFDEFEKIFSMKDGEQDELLTLFDGIDAGRKLFLVTCNDLSQVSEFMINRPGRFHYHFTMSPPSCEEVEEYMKDKLDPKYHDAIRDVVNLANITDMPYDYLRAICVELNQGYSLNEAMGDLNITRTNDTRFDVTAIFSNGMVYEAHACRIDLRSHNRDSANVRNYDKKNVPSNLYVGFVPAEAHIENGAFVITDKLNQWDVDSDNFDVSEDKAEVLAKEWNDNVRVVKIILKKSYSPDNSRYTIF